jgi:hypothetical protein
MTVDPARRNVKGAGRGCFAGSPSDSASVLPSGTQNVYYEEDIPALTILIDFAEDPEIVEKSKMILDLLLIDMGMHSWKGLFGATSGRCYEDQKFHPLKQDTLDIAEKVWGYGHRSEPDWQKISANFLLCEGYQIPPVIRKSAETRAK